jgi:hypothetical protein
MRNLSGYATYQPLALKRGTFDRFFNGFHVAIAGDSMMAKLRGRAFAWVLFVVSIVWVAAINGPVLYYLLAPKQDIQQIIRALEGRETLNGNMAPISQEVTDSAGLMRRALLVGAYWHVSGDYNIKESHTTRTAQLSYLAWFEKRKDPTILIVTRTEVDGSRLRYDIGEGDPFSALRDHLLPVLALALSAFWLLWTRSRSLKIPIPPGP